MRVTVLGKSPSWQDVDGACSGYLLAEGDTHVVLDMGNGVFGKLRRFRDYTEIDAVVLSHLHADHILDVVPYAYALTYAPRQQPVPVHVWPGTDEPARPRLTAPPRRRAPAPGGRGPEEPARPRLIAPPGARDVFRRIAGAWGPEDLIDNAFDLCEYGQGDEATVGPLTFSFHEVPHFTRTHAVSVRSANHRRRFAFSADSAPSEALVEFARDADLLFVEATLPRPEREGPRGHLTPREAGEHAKLADAQRVVLTHISDELDPEWARVEAERGFGHGVEVAVEGATYEV